MLKKNHYYIVDVTEFQKCDCCGERLRCDNITHTCNPKIVTYHRNKICRKNDFVSIINCQDAEKIKDDSMIFFDLETVQDITCHVPYACGFSVGNGEVMINYGKDCMDNFIDLLLKSENKTICAYNGAGFDFYILLNKLVDRGIDIENMILSNGALLSFKFGAKGKQNKVFDLYRFIASSLDKACKDYKIENVKMKIDILKVKSWDDSEKYKNEILPYLKYDVLSMRELFYTFNNSVFERDQVNITKYVTLSHMAYSIWSSSLEYLIEIPDMEKYKFQKKGCYGARCYPNQRQYKSKHYDKIINGKMTYRELLKSFDYMYNADATSLYPSSMCGFELCKVKYPIGKSRWSNNPEQEFKNSKCGYYTVEFICPKNIRIPILPRKKNINGVLCGLEWSLIDGSGVYTNVDIENAISCGYTAKFIEKCLVWDKTGDVFGKYVSKYYAMKEESDKEKNDVKRSIAKLMLNAMYGKTLQKAIFSTTKIINNHNDLLDFFREFDVLDFNILSEGRLLMTGDSIEKERKITKPAQLGGFVLSYSRRIMMQYFKAVDPSLETQCFSYTDTDSLHITGKAHQKLLSLGMIKSKDDSKLGYLCSDIKKEGLIIKEINLAPKCYAYEHINNIEEVFINDDAHLTIKGIPKTDKSKAVTDKEGKLILNDEGDIQHEKIITNDMYYNYETNKKVCSFSGLVKKNKNLSIKDIGNKVRHFSILNITKTSTFMKTEWSGMKRVDNEWYPFGYEFKK